MAILQLIKSLFLRSSTGANTANVPAPPSSAPQMPAGSSGAQSVERHFERHAVPGTSIETGWQEQAVLDQTGQLVEGREVLYLRTGCGHFVSHLDAPGPAAGQGAGIGGSCLFCRGELAAAFDRGEIPLTDVEILSLFCTSCAAPCDGCGRRNICCRHSLPVQTPDGRSIRLCPECREASAKKQFLDRVLRVCLMPFVEQDG